MRSKLDLAVISTFLITGLLLNFARYAPLIGVLITPDICYSIAWNVAATALSGTSGVTIFGYIIYLMMIPKDDWNGIYISRILAIFGAPIFLADIVASALILPGCYFAIPAMTFASHIVSASSALVGLTYHSCIGAYSIFRWSRGL